MGAGTALTATLVGVPLGIALARMELPFKAGMRILLAAPALLPSYVVGLAWLNIDEGSPHMTRHGCNILIASHVARAADEVRLHMCRRAGHLLLTRSMRRADVLLE